VKEVIIGPDKPTVLIGERINPAGRKELAAQLKAGDLEMVVREALAQAEAGADILDVNVSAFGVDEPYLLPRAVKAVMNAVDLPICIDSPKPEALSAALKVYRGKPLLNSVTGEELSLRKVMPVVRDYGAAVIGLLQDDKGIPKDVERRVSIARSIVERAAAEGIPAEDILIDPLAFAVGAYPNSGPLVLETIRRIRAELGVNMVLGASNVSFGLPGRSLLNSSFVSMAIAAGVTCHIVDPTRIRLSVLAADLLMGRDNHARRYIEAYRQRKHSS